MTRRRSREQKAPHMSPLRIRTRIAVVRTVALAMLALTALSAAGAPRVAQAQVVTTGSGSSYVALAMEQWTASAQPFGIRVNYNGTLGSPAGVSQYKDQQVDFAGTEAEVVSLQAGDPNVGRGYQYVPDVAGAIAVMYNIRDTSGNTVDYLHLDQRTIARIFTGEITTWADPAIAATNGGVALPNETIRVAFRGGQSGTTALFYDFVREAAPDVYGPWRDRLNLQDFRIIELPGGGAQGQFAPNIAAQPNSDAMAQFVASPGGLWSIGYDEFGYALKHDAEVAWVQNGANAYQLPYAENITEALKDATLRPDLSQELSGVYRSARPEAYPISAYSYMMVQCAATGDRPTCVSPYGDTGTSDTLARFMRFVACDGQTNMSRIGYAPLPPNLSQEMANAVGRLTGAAPEQLSADNCANPRFQGDGNLGDNSVGPPDPFGGLAGGIAANTNAGPAPAQAAAPVEQAGAAGPAAEAGTPEAAAAEAAAAAATAAAESASASESIVPETAAAGLAQDGAQAVGGGSSDWRDAEPTGFLGGGPFGVGVLPVLVLLGAIWGPPATMASTRWIRNLQRRANGET